MEKKEKSVGIGSEVLCLSDCFGDCGRFACQGPKGCVVVVQKESLKWLPGTVAVMVFVGVSVGINISFLTRVVGVVLVVLVGDRWGWIHLSCWNQLFACWMGVFLLSALLTCWTTASLIRYIGVGIGIADIGIGVGIADIGIGVGSNANIGIGVGGD